jgi:hypothetical protein
MVIDFSGVSYRSPLFQCQLICAGEKKKFYHFKGEMQAFFSNKAVGLQPSAVSSYQQEVDC